MTEYASLEDKILIYFKDENLSRLQIDNKRMNELFDIFNPYWEKYQDRWNDKYWEVYYYLNDSENVVSKTNFEPSNALANLHTNKAKAKFFNDSFLENEFSENVNENKNDENDFVIKNKFEERDNIKSNSTEYQTKTFTQLDIIDDDLKKYDDVSIIKEKKPQQPEKRRNCFECNIF